MERNDNIQALQHMPPEAYPVLYKELYSYKGAMLRRLEQLIQLGQTFPSWKWFPASVEKLIAKYGGSASTWQSNREYWAAVGLVKVRKPGRGTTSKAMQESVRRAQEGRRAVNWYAIPDYTPALFQAAEQAAERFKASGVNRKALTVQGVIIAMGQKQAQKTVVDWRTRSARDRAIENEIVRQIKMAVKRKGYAEKDNVLRRAARITATKNKIDFIEAYCSVRNLWANRNKRLLFLAGMKYGRPTKDEKQRFRLKDNHWILTRAEPF